MAKIPDLKRVTVEDFRKEDRAIVSKLAFIINSFHEQVRSALAGNIDFTNLSQETRTITFTTGSDGQPLNPITFNSGLRLNIQGISVVRTVITSNNLVFQESQPVISWSQNEARINISYIGGLAANTEYQLTLLTF